MLDYFIALCEEHRNLLYISSEHRVTLHQTRLITSNSFRVWMILSFSLSFTPNTDDLMTEASKNNNKGVRGNTPSSARRSLPELPSTSNS